jgi:hypothetical protein
MSQYSPPKDVVVQRNTRDARYQNQLTAQGYNIGTFEYPEGLRNKPDLQHYVAFYINVRDKSTMGKNNKNNDPNYYVSKEEQKRINALSTSNLDQASIESGVQFVKKNAGKLGALAGFLATAKVPKSLGDAATIAGATAGGYVAADTITKMVDKLKLGAFSSGTTSRLKEVVTLHIEDRPSVKYGVNYTEKELGALFGGLTQFSAAESANRLKGELPEMQARVLSEFLKLPSLKAGGGTLSDLRELATRTRTNPFREVLFESVDYRTFTFRYRFFPKSENETNKIRDIIQLFKIHMHPEQTAGKMFYIYPSEFDIQYFFKDKGNPYLHEFARCALTDMQVDYGGDTFATFNNGAPVEVGLSLTFRELEQMTSQGIHKNGY